jgi:PAS domain S-box-containing protein
MKRLLIIVILVQFIVFGGLGQKKRVLVLHSYHQGLTWTDNASKGILSVLGDQKNIELHFDYLDTKRNIDPYYFDLLTNLYRFKMANTTFDAIISVDNNALKFLRQNGNTLFPNVPVVFCAVNNFSFQMINGVNNVRGVAENADFEGTIKTMLSLHPQLDTIMVVNDSHTTTAIQNKEKMKPLIAKYQSNVAFKYLENLPLNQLTEKIEKLKGNKAILLLNFSKDSEGKFISYIDLLHLMKQKTQLPIYSLWNFFLNEGIVGGMLTSGFKQGEKAGQITLKILQGKAKNIPLVIQGENELQFDYVEMKKIGISEEQLPKGSSIINHPPSFYNTYKPIIWLSIGFFLLMLILLYVSIYFQHQKEKRLIAINLELDKRVAKRTSELLRANQTLIHQQKKIIRQKEELETHRHNLLELVKERTSDLQEANLKLSNNHNRLRLMLDANSDGVWEYHVKKKEYDISTNFWNKLGYSTSEIEDKKNILLLLMQAEDLPFYQKTLENYIKSNRDIFKFEFRLRGPKGELFWISTHGKSIENDKYGTPLKVVGTFLNITARKTAEEKNKENQITVLNAIWEAEERERSRMAKDLHDGIGPILSSIKLAVSALKKAKTTERKEEVMEVTQEAINEAIISTKEIANNLSPHILRDFGLVYAYNNFIRKFKVTSGLQIHFINNVTDQRFDPNIEIVFYRTFTELLNNTLKHAKAETVEVNLFRKANTLHLNYLDDGIGITVEQRKMYWDIGMGLSNIGNRIHSVRGKYQIKSKENDGFQVRIEVPLPKQSNT